MSKKLLDDEEYKSSINRSYYSIFHAIRTILAMERQDFKKHSAVIAYFQKEYIKTRIFDAKFSKYITRASLYRNKSDYEDFYIAFKKDAEEQYSHAKELYKAVEEYVKKSIPEIEI